MQNTIKTRSSPQAKQNTVRVPCAIILIKNSTVNVTAKTGEGLSETITTGDITRKLALSSNDRVLPGQRTGTMFAWGVWFRGIMFASHCATHSTSLAKGRRFDSGLVHFFRIDLHRMIFVAFPIGAMTENVNQILFSEQQIREIN